MSMSEKKKEFYHNLIWYFINIFLFGSIFCILYSEVGFYNIWIFIKKLTILSIENWFVSLPVLGMLIGFSFFIFSMFLKMEEACWLLKQGTILLLGSFLIFTFLSMPIIKAHHKAKENQEQITEIQKQPQIEIVQPENK